MRRKPKSKALHSLTNTLWNNAWQAFCPWVAGADISPAQAPRINPRRRSKLRSLAAALFLTGALMGFTGPAMAASDSGLLHYASLNPNTPSDREQGYSTPQLFGHDEVRHTDLTPFTKWTGVLNRFKRSFNANANRPEVAKWLSFIGSLEGASVEKKISAVNAYFNKIRFVPDSKNYGMRDYWATPIEFLTRGEGDCEDYAISKYISLRALGVPKDKMRLAIVNDSVMRMPHALLIVYNKGQAMVLDNQNPDILDSADISRYTPIYSISQLAWWRH